MKNNKPNIDDYFARARGEDPVLSKDEARYLIENRPRKTLTSIIKKGITPMNILITTFAAAAATVIMTVAPFSDNTSEADLSHRDGRITNKVTGGGMITDDNYRDLAQTQLDTSQQQVFAANDTAKSINRLELDPKPLDIKGVNIIELDNNELKKLGVDVKSNGKIMFPALKKFDNHYKDMYVVLEKENISIVDGNELGDNPIIPRFVSDSKGNKRVSLISKNDYGMLQFWDTKKYKMNSNMNPITNTVLAKMNYKLDTANIDKYMSNFDSLMKGFDEKMVHFDINMKEFDKAMADFDEHMQDIDAKFQGLEFSQGFLDSLKNELDKLPDMIQYDGKEMIIRVPGGDNNEIVKIVMDTSTSGDSKVMRMQTSVSSDDIDQEQVSEIEFKIKNLDNTIGDINDYMNNIEFEANIDADSMRKYINFMGRVHHDSLQKMNMKIRYGNQSDKWLFPNDEEVSINQLVPVAVKIDGVIEYILWYEANDNLIKTLPAHARKKLGKEISTFENIESTCNTEAIKDDEAYLEVWRQCSGAIEYLSLSPNPATDMINLEYDLTEERTISITLHDVLGREIKKIVSSEYKNIGHHAEYYQINDLPAGMYLVSVQSDTGENAVQRLIIK